MDGRFWRGAIVAFALLTAVIALIVGAAGRGETIENSVEDICESAVWPRIPATCFSRAQPVRWRRGHSMVDGGGPTDFVEVTTPPGSSAISAKADLLQRPETRVHYRTLETRDGGVSILRRVEVGSHDRAH